MVRAAVVWLRHDFWRPASWLATGLAAAGSYAASADASVVVILAVLPAAVVTAVGEVPAGIPRWAGMTALSLRGWRRLYRPEPTLPGGLAWLLLRLLWPLAGWVAGGLAASYLTFEPGAIMGSMVAGGLALLLAGITLAGFLWVGLTAADAATATLVAGWSAAGGVATAGGPAGLPPAGVAVVVGVAVWLFSVLSLLAIFCWLSSRGGEPLVGGLPRAEPLSSSRAADRLALISLLGLLPARSPWRRFLRAMVMGGLLAGMVGWLLLMPGASGGYAVLASLAFGGLAIPAASLLDGWRVRRGWEVMAATTTGGPWWSPAVPNAATQAVVVLAGHAAVVLWPPLVVAAVAWGGPAAMAAGSVAASVAGGVGLVSLGCILAALARARGETVLGIGLCLLFCVLWGVGSQLL